MKKLLVLALTALLIVSVLFAFSSCKPEDDDSGEPKKDDPVTDNNDPSDDKNGDNDTTSTGDNDTPSTGDNDTPSTGDNDTPSTGDNDTPSTGDNDTPSTGDNDTPSTGDNDTPSTGDNDTPSAGDNDTPSTGDNDTPSTGDNDTPSAGDNDTPSTGDNDTPSTGENDTPSTGDNDTPSAGGDETPSTGDDTPSSGDSDKVSYKITWKDKDGKTLSTQNVSKGSVPTYTYKVTDTAEWDYTFKGWSETPDGKVLSAIPAASKDATYYAVVSAVKQKYRVTFNSNGGSNVESKLVEYGEKVAVPTAPKRDGYKFVSWVLTLNGTDKVDFDKAITSSVTYYASWNSVADVKGLLKTLLTGYSLDPYSYIPDKMKPAANLVEADKIISDYSSFVSISDIDYGYGEQWQMVLDNLDQSMTFFNTLSLIEGVVTTSVAEFNNHFDNNPDDTAHHEFVSGIYSVTVHFDGETISYVLDYTANIPLLGEQTVQIAMSMDSGAKEKVVRIQIGDANALTYKMRADSYEFAIKYAGVRRAMFSVKRAEDGTVSGRIYEYLTVSESIESASAADFYIGDDHVSVVGNKADGIIGFDNYISELYNKKTGKLIGYEVKETKSVAGISVEFNTLWFSLCDISGMNSIKYQASDTENDIDAAFFVNGSSTVWESKKVGGFILTNKKAESRRFDIEFRTQYVYTYDTETKEYTRYKVQVPMLFVQEENYDTLVSDVKETNGVDIRVSVGTSDMTKLQSDYDTLIPTFISNKDNITSQSIVDYIGSKRSFKE